MRPMDSERCDVTSSTKWLSCRMRRVSGRPLILGTTDHLLGKAVVLVCPGRVRGKSENALFVSGALLEPDALADDGREDLVAEDALDPGAYVLGQVRAAIVDGDQHAEEFEVGVGSRADLLVGVEQIVGALERIVGGLNRYDPRDFSQGSVRGSPFL